jgi:endonuclease YncB( thermonuclease family)
LATFDSYAASQGLTPGVRDEWRRYVARLVEWLALSDLRGVINDTTFGAEREALRSLVSLKRTFAPCAVGSRDTCVVDGDTIWLDGVKIRIADIDTPEIRQPKCSGEKVLGERAKQRLIVLLNEAGHGRPQQWA